MFINIPSVLCVEHFPLVSQVLILSRPWTRRLPCDVPTDAGFICDKAASSVTLLFTWLWCGERRGPFTEVEEWNDGPVSVLALFITAFTTALHMAPSWARWIQWTPSHPIYLRSILIISYHSRQGIPSGLFHSGIPTKILYAFLFSPIFVTCPANLIIIDLVTRVKCRDHEAPHYAVLSSRAS